jgi:hypothetical protein
MEDRPFYQVQGRINRDVVKEKARQLEILRASFIHLDVLISPDHIFPEDFPPQYIEAVCLAMAKYKSDDKPRLTRQLEDQESFIRDLISRKDNYQDWRYKELMDYSKVILERIKYDLSEIDKY